MSHFYAYISKMKWIKRWGLMKNTAEENIMEHSWQVAVIAHGLAVIENRLYGKNINPEHIAMIALYHEIGEVVTGDVATPIKYYNPEVKTAFAELEDIACEKIFSMLPKELQKDFYPVVFHDSQGEEYRLVKASDKLCAYLKCVEELKWGNKEFEKAKISIEKDLKNMDIPSVKYFMDTFVPSFSLTIDELN